MYGEYVVFQTETLQEGLLEIIELNADPADRPTGSNADLLDALFSIGRHNLENQAGWGLIAVQAGTKLIHTPYPRFNNTL